MCLFIVYCIFYTEKKLLFLLNNLRISKKSSTFAAESRLKNVH